MMGDESPQSITDVKKKRRRRLVYLAIAVVLWYVVSYVVFGAFTGDAFVYGEKPGIYWLECHKDIGVKVAIFAPFVAAALLLLIPGFIMGEYNNQLLTAFILALLFYAGLILLGPMLNLPHHVQTVQYGDHVYHLAERIRRITMLQHACWQQASDPDCIEAEFTHEYFVYQCGPLDVVCREIASKTFEERIWRSHGELSVNAEGSIVLTVDGKWFWTYPTASGGRYDDG